MRVTDSTRREKPAESDKEKETGAGPKRRKNQGTCTVVKCCSAHECARIVSFGAPAVLLVHRGPGVGVDVRWGSGSAEQIQNDSAVLLQRPTHGSIKGVWSGYWCASRRAQDSRRQHKGRGSGVAMTGGLMRSED